MAQIDVQEYYTAGIKSNANVIFKVSISYFKKSVSYTYIKLEKKNKTLMSSTLADYKEVDSKGSTYLFGSYKSRCKRRSRSLYICYIR